MQWAFLQVIIVKILAPYELCCIKILHNDVNVYQKLIKNARVFFQSTYRQEQKAESPGSNL